MSTRATYEFKQTHGKSVFFYLHHDNYVEGAAAYFWRMHTEGGKKEADSSYDLLKGGLAEKFIKANPGEVEFTESHESHADTEYRYTMFCTGELVCEAVNYINGKDVWTNIFDGHYAEFINLHYEDDDKEMLYEIECVNWLFMTLKQVEDEVKKSLDDVLIKGYQQYSSRLEKWMKEAIRLGKLTSKQFI